MPAALCSPYFMILCLVRGKRGNVQISNSSQVGIEWGPLDLKSSTLPNELKGARSLSPVLVVVVVNTKHAVLS